MQRELVEILDEGFAKLTQDEAIAALNSIDAPVDRVQTTEDLLSDPQVLANNYVYKLEATVPPENADNAEIMVPASPIKFNNVESGVVGNKRGPGLGENSVEILKRYGYSEEEIKDFIDRKITSTVN